MIVYLIRHGKAEPRAPSGRDADRNLVDQGISQSIWLGEQLDGKSGLAAPQYFLVSTYLRAQQTAALIHERTSGTLRTESALEPGNSASDILRAAERVIDFEHPESIALVGHNPVMETLVCTLTGDQSWEAAEMRTGTAAMIEFGRDSIAVGKGTLHSKLRLGQ